MVGCPNLFATMYFVLPDMFPGQITLWAGMIDAIPAGYVFCDGTHGTPDLRDKFVICAQQDRGPHPQTFVEGAWKQSGGEASHAHATPTFFTMADNGSEVYQDATTGTTITVPPYYALAYIMKT